MSTRLHREQRRKRYLKLAEFKKEIREERMGINIKDKKGDIYHVNKHGMVVRGASEEENDKV